MRYLLALWIPLLLFGAHLKQRVELGYFGTTGNSNTNSLTAGYKLNYHKKKNKLQFSTDILYATREGKKSSERYRAQLDLYHYKKPTFYYYTQLSFLRNTFEGYNQQYNISPGFGYRLYKSPRNRVDFLIGYLFRRNNYTTQNSQNFNYIKGELKFLHKFTQKNSFDATLDYIENIEHSKDFESHLTTNMKLWIVKSFHFKLTFELKYDNLPPQGKLKTDTITKAAIVYSF